MENNGVIYIDSSDDESPPCKVPKYNNKGLSDNKNRFENAQSPKIEDKVKKPILEDDNLLSKENGKPEESKVRRIELITIKDEKENPMESKDITEIVDDSDCEIEDINHDLDSELNNKPSTSANSDESQTEISSEFETFLNKCISCNCEKKYKDMMVENMSNIKLKYEEADEKYVGSDNFKEYINSKIQYLERCPKNAIIIFNEVLRELEGKRKLIMNLSEREKDHLNLLYQTLKKISKKVKRLEMQPVDLDADQNSSYIMLERYKERLCTIYKKICTITNSNFYCGRHLFNKLDCNVSKYSEINHAICKLYNKKKAFPSFHDADKCVRKCVQNHNINLSEEALTREIRKVFEEVGNVIQRRRKLELYESLSFFLDGRDEDPAAEDPEFEEILKTRHNETQKKTDEIIQEYAEIQEKNPEQPLTLSSDTDDSHYVSEEDES